MMANLFESPTLFISHELRTPLTSIQGVLGLLQTGQLGDLSDEGYRLIAIALNNANRLTRLANTIEQAAVTPIKLLSSTEIEQLQLENSLHHALNQQQFQLVYQPIIETNPERIVSFEALLRWQHPTQGDISPTVFIPMAERTGIIQQLGLWALKQACYQLADWQRQFSGAPPISISVNLSVVQLLQPDLLQQIQQILQESKIAPGSLKLEITETMLIANQDVAIYLLSQFRSMGLQVYLDDFGTGYSSLARLQDLPIDALKIDRSFIQSKRWDISETIILLASRLGLQVIAEGVETPEDSIALQSLGCNRMQGYFFSRPIAEVAATKLLKFYSDKHLNN
ncbi:MAG: EAL domain-containing protein [Oculatellaceae cyanobacterium bins.114]|nr:EAL domain-containing protein [Oculatellaceae cyanobacterium bins.114]